MNMKYSDIITIEAGKRGGKPCIRGMRITVYDVLSYLAAGMTFEEILQDFPYLTRDDILASLSFVAEREKHTLAARSFFSIKIFRRAWPRDFLICSQIPAMYRW